MGSTTPVLGLPYPVGTDLVKDGDNAIQALAERVEAMLRGRMGSAQVTTGQTGIAAVTDLTGLSVTVTTVTGQRIRVTSQVMVSSTVAGDLAQVCIKEGATTLQTLNFNTGPSPNSNHGVALLTPAAGSHTYKLTLARGGGTGSLTLNADPLYPAIILVETVGV